MSKDNDSQQKISSPCVRNCCLDEQDICLGCWRSIDEILGWHGAGNDERMATLNACQIRKDKRLSR